MKQLPPSSAKILRFPDPPEPNVPKPALLLLRGRGGWYVEFVDVDGVGFIIGGPHRAYAAAVADMREYGKMGGLRNIELVGIDPSDDEGPGAA